MGGGRYLLIWPNSFTLSVDDEFVGIVDATGRVVARVGDEIQFGAVSVSYQKGQDHGGMREISTGLLGGLLGGGRRLCRCAGFRVTLISGFGMAECIYAA